MVLFDRDGFPCFLLGLKCVAFVETMSFLGLFFVKGICPVFLIFFGVFGSGKVVLLSF